MDTAVISFSLTIYTSNISPIIFLTQSERRLEVKESWYAVVFQEEELKGAVVLIYANKQVHVIIIFLFCLSSPQ